jgi:hypothetical protein
MKPMAKRLVIRALTVQGCLKLKLSEEGKHEKWGCPERCGQHTTAAPRHADMTGLRRGLRTGSAEKAAHLAVFGDEVVERFQRDMALSEHPRPRTDHEREVVRVPGPGQQGRRATLNW